MTALLPEQIEALRELREASALAKVDLVVIGATALRLWLPDVQRVTEDIDVALALDLDEFAKLTTRLVEFGWSPDRHWEPRWLSKGLARVDLLPIGPRARQTKRIVWPRAETVMRVVGYDSIFRTAISRKLATDLEMRVAPLEVIALLKLAAFVEEPAVRQKDLGDLLVILDRYAEDGERRFGEDVLDAGIDFSESGGFLLGRDLRRLCAAPEETDAVRRFLAHVTHRDFQIPVSLRRWRHTEHHTASDPLDGQFRALARGFGLVGG